MAAISAGIPQRWIAESAYASERDVVDGRRVKVGVNRYLAEEEDDGQLALFAATDDHRERQRARTAARLARRDHRAAGASLDALEAAARGDANVMPVLLDCARAGVTLGEIGAAPAAGVRRAPGAGAVVAGAVVTGGPGGGPLAGTRVVDLTRFVSGAYTTMLLASLGAEVVKVEVPPEGDPYRGQGAERVGDESALFLCLNNGKRSLAIDFRVPGVPRRPGARCWPAATSSCTTPVPAASTPTGSTRRRSAPGTRTWCTARSRATATSGPTPTGAAST